MIAATLLDAAAIPTDHEYRQRKRCNLATKTVLRTLPQDASIVHIANTLEIIEIDVSEALLPYIEANPAMFDVVGELAPFDFDRGG